MARVCLFDVNETLLDLGALDPHFERAFGDAGVRRSWFLQVLQSALVATVTGAYSDFGAVGAAALDMTAERQGVRLSDMVLDPLAWPPDVVGADLSAVAASIIAAEA